MHNVHQLHLDHSLVLSQNSSVSYGVATLVCKTLTAVVSLYR